MPKHEEVFSEEYWDVPDSIEWNSGRRLEVQPSATEETRQRAGELLGEAALILASLADIEYLRPGTRMNIRECNPGTVLLTDIESLAHSESPKSAIMPEDEMSMNARSLFNYHMRKNKLLPYPLVEYDASTAQMYRRRVTLSVAIEGKGRRPGGLELPSPTAPRQLIDGAVRPKMSPRISEATIGTTYLDAGNYGRVRSVAIVHSGHMARAPRSIRQVLGSLLPTKSNP